MTGADDRQVLLYNMLDSSHDGEALNAFRLLRRTSGNLPGFSALAEALEKEGIDPEEFARAQLIARSLDRNLAEAAAQVKSLQSDIDYLRGQKGRKPVRWMLAPEEVPVRHGLIAAFALAARGYLARLDDFGKNLVNNTIHQRKPFQYWPARMARRLHTDPVMIYCGMIVLAMPVSLAFHYAQSPVLQCFSPLSGPVSVVFMGALSLGLFDDAAAWGTRQAGRLTRAFARAAGVPLAVAPSLTQTKTYGPGSESLQERARGPAGP